MQRACYHQGMRTHILQRAGMAAPIMPLLACALLAGCNPTYNWRDYASQDHSYKVLFPARPASFTRAVDLNGVRVQMTMTAAEVDGATFAVGSAVLPDAARAQAALPAMRRALLRNIGAPDTGAAAADGSIDASGNGANGQPVRLIGRFEARGARIYQVVVMGKADAAPPEQVEQFLTSFTSH